MGALNTYCLRPQDVSRGQSGRVAVDPPNAHGMRARVKPGPETEVWDVTLDLLTNTERLAVRTIFAAAGYTGTILWTSPDDAGDRRYQFVDGSFKETTRTAACYPISFSLRHAPGIAV